MPRSLAEVPVMQDFRGRFARHNYSPPGHSNPRLRRGLLSAGLLDFCQHCEQLVRRAELAFGNRGRSVGGEDGELLDQIDTR